MEYSESDPPGFGREMRTSSLLSAPSGKLVLNFPKTDGSGVAGSVYTRVYDERQTRIVLPRFGVVLANNTPPMDLLLMTCLAGGSAGLGSGKQPFPWVHMDDAVEALLWMINSDEVLGPVNVVAPQIVSNSQFSNALEEACFSKSRVPALPASIVRLMYGKERADNILLDSPKVVPRKLLDGGFQFKYPDIGSAMKAVMEAQCNLSSVYSKLLAFNKSRYTGKS